jgi:hypothetical protein
MPKVKTDSSSLEPLRIEERAGTEHLDGVRAVIGRQGLAPALDCLTASKMRAADETMRFFSRAVPCESVEEQLEIVPPCVATLLSGGAARPPR